MRTRILVAVALIAAAAGSLIPAAPAGASTVSFVITRNVMGSWTESSSATAAGTFVASTGAPLGVGGYQMTTGPGTSQAGGLQTIRNRDYANTRIADLTALSYSTLVPFQNRAQELKNGQAANQVPTLAPVLSIPITTGSTTSNLVFEPVYSTAKFGGHANPVALHDIVFDGWQDWDTLAGTWWSSAAIPGVCAVSCYVTWNTIVANNPDATITAGGIALSAGQSSPGAPWANIRGAVDKVTVGVSTASTTFDFEPVRLPSRPGNFAGWAANDSGAPSISFADDIPSQRDLGGGSLHFAGTTAPRADVSQSGWNGLRLTDVQGLSYDTFVATPAATASLAPEITLNCTGCGPVLASLVFDPNANANQGPVQSGRWQHWDARTGLWSLTGPTAVPGQLLTLDQWQAQFPLARISSTKLGVGGDATWQGFTGMADAFNIEIVSSGTKYDATYDFEGLAASITSFSPTTGPAGTAVTITGTKLGATGETRTVYFNTTPTSGTVVDPQTITTTVPATATTGVITVLAPSGPVVSTGNFVTGNAGLRTYEQTDASFTYTGAGWQTLSDATESGGSAAITPNTGSYAEVGFTGSTIHWVGLRGPNTAVASVSVDGGPVSTIDTYAPQYEAQQVLFAADGYAPGSHTMRITYSGRNPSAAATAYLVVDAIETQPFQPTITNFSPVSGPAGTTVQITGTHLDGVTSVQFNGTAASYTVASASSLSAVVPSGATTGPITVSAGTQSATSATNFTVEPTPVFTLIRHEETDTSVFNFTSSGGWFRWSDTATGGGQSGGAAELNSQSGSFVDVSFNGAVVNWIGLKGPNTAIGAIAIDGVSFGTVDTYAPSYSAKQVLFAKSDLPAGPHLLRITYAGKNAAAATTSYLVVDAVDLAPPTAAVTSFDPVGGPGGTVVTINGTNFTNVTAVQFNGTPATTFNVVSPTQLTATVPAGATTGLISVTNGGGTTNSRSPFTMAAAAMHRFEQTASSFHYTGGGWFLWSDSVTGGGESGGSAQLTPAAGDFAEITVTGDTVNVVGLKGPNAAIATITIDGVSFGSVDSYAPTYSAQQVLFSAGGLTPGPHTIRVTYTGRNPSAAATSYLVLDAIEAAGVI
jgi:hypothetical protein